ncbi:MAG: 50S ribosomal protein L28 [Candidatus Alcyoniella australis]|nr:50S ribosomal protein L28 [Candidatus Alcyoniella australis]
MSRVCEICGKGRLVGYNISHSHIKTKKVQLPNLQRIRIVQDGTVKRVRVCTSCIKAGKVQKAV